MIHDSWFMIQPLTTVEMPKPLPQSSSNPFRLLSLPLFCFFFYILGSYTNLNTTPHIHFEDTTYYCPKLNLSTHSTQPSSLDFQPHHKISIPKHPFHDLPLFSFCPKNFTDYCPCHDPTRESLYDVEKKFYRERHCPGKEEVIRCLVPRPAGYRTPFRWPESIKYDWFHNVPFTKLVSYKKSQNWVLLQGDRFVFPGGGTSFRAGVKDYVDELNRVIPLKSGSIRTVLDVGCGVASFSAALVEYNILTMSIAPRDIHEAQVQFAMERGLPAMLGILSIHRLPFPSRSFDMVHCSRCLVPWTDYGGLYLMEVDRILRPGGYWVLSGPPVNWKPIHKGWKRQGKDLQKEQAILDDLARRLCWRKTAELDSTSVWRKPTNHIQCLQKSKVLKSPHFCNASDPDAGWYRKMEPCITPLPNVKNIKDISGGALGNWPKRLNVEPPRIRNSQISRSSVSAFYQDNQLWKRRVSYYETILKPLTEGKYRNVMDMNANLGGFASALSKYKVWVMNVIPSDANNTLGAIYERGLIGTYMNWCEAFSTYPRTYDLIHADRIFSMYMDKCDVVDILLEMHRILRPEGAIIIRDHINIIVKVKGIIEKIRWKGNIQHSEPGPSHPEKILVVDNSELINLVHHA